MPEIMHVFDFMDSMATVEHGVAVFWGDELFLKRLALSQVKRAGSEDPPTCFVGTSAVWRDVFDELSTYSLFNSGGIRRVVVEDADKRTERGAEDFVSKNRSELEAYVEKPQKTAVLILDVLKWPSNTRLSKLVAQHGLTVDCRPPQLARGKTKSLDTKKLCQWLVRWAQQQHQVVLEPEAANSLVEMIGPEIGLLDQEIAKLSLYLEVGEKITRELVHDLVGGWQTKTTWELLDAAASGDACEALRQLDRLLQSGQHPNALFGQISWALRRYAAATRIFEQAEREGRRVTLSDALQQAGFRNWPQGTLQRAEKALKQLRRERAGKFYHWLLEVDLALKGSHSTPSRSRFVLEQLFLRMARA